MDLRAVCLAVSLCIATLAEAQDAPFLVKDIFPGPDPTLQSGPGNLIEFAGALYFATDDGIHGQELWRSDGTETGTALVADINPGRQRSSPAQLTRVEGLLLFTAYDPAHGTELWKTDGTSGGTILVKDINPGPDGGLFPAPLFPELVNVNGTLFFPANDGTHGRELWRSDGTPEGTVRVKHFNVAAGEAYFSQLTSVNGRLFFVSNDEADARGLWTSDGTEAGTAFLTALQPFFLTPANETLFFVAADPVGGAELWRSDGTAAGTALVRGFTARAEHRLPPSYLTNVEGELFFVADDDSPSCGIWKSDGTEAGTVLVKAVRADGGCYRESYFPFPYPPYVGPSSLAAVNGSLYFATADGALWKSDGTTPGTLMVKGGLPGFGGCSGFETFSCPPVALTAAGQSLFFVAEDGVLGPELWKTDGTAAGTVLVRDIRKGELGSQPVDLTDVKGTLFFNATDGINGRQLWKSDGAASGTLPVKDLFPIPGSSLPEQQTNVDGTLFFVADDRTHGHELWRSDGTDAGTALVKDILPGPYGSQVSDLFPVDGTLFFVASDGISSSELWATDGTAGGTRRLTGSGFSAPASLANVKGTLFFSASDAWADRELWKTDGTPEGTVRVKDIRPGSFNAGALSSAPYWLTEVNGTLLFTADDGVHGVELWKSNGTDAGTVLVKDIVPGAGGLGPFGLRNLGGTLYFQAYAGTSMQWWKSDGTDAGTVPIRAMEWAIANGTEVRGTRFFAWDDGAHGTELWKASVGTSEGVLVKDISPGIASSFPASFTVADGLLFFVANDGTRAQLWKSDGTEAGTVLFKDTVPPGGGPSVTHLTNLGGTLVFISSTPDGRPALWKSDGTAEGTVPIGGIEPNSVAPLTVAGSNLFFTANDGTTGDELWAMPLAAVTSTCVGDCDGSGQVTVDELVRGVAIALGTFPLNDCAALDFNQDGKASIDELVAAVNVTLHSCR